MKAIILDAVMRTNSSDGNEFVALVIGNDEVNIVTSNSGNQYIKQVRLSLPFPGASLATAKLLVGQTLPGAIRRVDCEPYSFISRSGEKVTLQHTYRYFPTGSNVSIGEETEKTPINPDFVAK